MRAVVRLGRPETTSSRAIGICFAIALLAQRARLLGRARRVPRRLAGRRVGRGARRSSTLVQPVRDMFAAVFFVVGRHADRPGAGRRALARDRRRSPLVVVVGKVTSVVARRVPHRQRHAHLGRSRHEPGADRRVLVHHRRASALSLGATGAFLYPVAVAVSAITTLLTPWLIRALGPVATFVDRKLPKPLQTFVALYGSWIDELRTLAPRVALPDAAVRAHARSSTSR